MLRLARWLSRYASAHAVLVVSVVVSAGLLVGLTAASAEVYEAVVEDDGIAGLDRPALQQAQAWRNPTLVRAVNAFTHLGGPLGMTVIASLVTAAMVWRWRSRTPVVLLVIGVAGSLAMTNLGKVIVGRARPSLADAVPPYETSASFPSGHTLNSTVIAGLVAYLLLLHLKSRWAATLAVVGAVVWFAAMGLSRVFLGHHWLSDVAMGWTLGLAWVVAVIIAHRLFLKVRRIRAAR